MPDLTRKRSRDDAAEAILASEERVHRDLRSRGMASALARPLAARIAPQAARLSEDAYALFLDGVLAAQGGEAVGTDRQEHAAPGTRGRSEARVAAEAGAAELQRLMQDFATELKKLDEGLRLLSAYLLRIRDRTAREPSRTVH
jgi:hypothetical protein